MFLCWRYLYCDEPGTSILVAGDEVNHIYKLIVFAIDPANPLA
jgi:hypothetical protein